MKFFERVRQNLAQALVAGRDESRQEFGLEDLDSWRPPPKTSAALYAATYLSCMRIRCDALARLPAKVLREQADGGSEKQRGHPLWGLLALRPNGYMSAHDFLWATEFQRLHYGDAFWLIETARGAVRALHLLDSARMAIYVDGGPPDRPTVYYLYSDPKQGELLYKEEQIVHLKNFCTDGIRGASMRKYLADLLKNENAATGMLTERYESGLQDPIIVQYTGDLDNKRQRQIQRKFALLGGAKQAGKVVPVPYEFRVSQLETKLVNSQFFELQGLSAQRIANAFGVKSFQLNDMSGAKYNNVVEQTRAFYSDTMQNVVIAYEQEMDWKLFHPFEREQGYFVRFNLDAVLRSDPDKRMQTHVLAVQHGIRSRKEVREMEGLPYILGTEQLTVDNGAAIPLSKLGTQYEHGKTEEMEETTDGES